MPSKPFLMKLNDRFGGVYGKQPGDNNAYTTGKLGPHNVVLWSLPGMGKGSAAAAAANLRVSYRNIKLVLLVGICGAVPFLPDKVEVMLGDIIISNAVVEYDFGRQYPDEFRRKSDVRETLGRPAQEIRAFLAGLGGRKAQIELQDQICQYLQTLQAKGECKHPGIVSDVLFEGSFQHKHYLRDATDRCICFDCSDTMCDEALKGDCVRLGCAGSKIQRKRQTAIDGFKPLVHIGKIASADTVMKSGRHRDELAKKDSVIAFEMEYGIICRV
ncbi:nucleoside phosphorylase domain-containing protein [Aspergillus oleicola]